MQISKSLIVAIIPESVTMIRKQWEQFQQLINGALKEYPKSLQYRLSLFLLLIRYLPILRYGRVFDQINPDQQTDFLLWLQDNRIEFLRKGFWGIRTLIMLGFYGQSEIVSEIGYQPNKLGWGA